MGSTTTTAPLFESTITCTQNTYKRKDYKVPERMGYLAHRAERVLPSQPFIGISTYKDDYKDFSSTYHDIIDHPVDDFDKAFDKVASEDGYISRKDIKPLLSTTLGRNPTKLEVDEFDKAFEKNKDGLISRDDLINKVPVIEEKLREDLHTHANPNDIPEWNRRRERDRIINGPPPDTTYHYDVGKFGDNPTKRVAKTEFGMTGTTCDLYHGTTKNSCKIPGYGGHIPKNTWNKFSHQQAHIEGGTDYKTNDLRITMNNNKQGYAGFYPASTENWHGEIKPNPAQSTSESALHSAQEMWKTSDLKTAKKLDMDFWNRIPVI